MNRFLTILKVIIFLVIFII